MLICLATYARYLPAKWLKINELLDVRDLMGLNTYKVLIISNDLCTHVISKASIFQSKFAKKIMKDNGSNTSQKTIHQPSKF